MNKRTVKRAITSTATGVLAVLALMAASAMAQVHGVPAGATSLGGNHTYANPPGVPASATSLGPRGLNTQQGYPWHPPANGNRDGHHAQRVIIPVAVPLYSYGVYPYLNSYSSVETEPADYHAEPEVVRAPQPQVVQIQQPAPQVIVIDNRGVRDATADEREQALATSKQASKPKQQEPRVEAKPEPEDVGPMTLIVFRDGTRKEVKNYAIMGKELIELNAGSLHRFLLADIDVPATQKENDVRGLDFKLP